MAEQFGRQLPLIKHQKKGDRHDSMTARVIALESALISLMGLWDRDDVKDEWNNEFARAEALLTKKWS